MTKDRSFSLSQHSLSMSSRIANLRWLIFDLKCSDARDSAFITAIVDYEAKLFFYVVEDIGMQTILRYGDGCQFVLSNNDFRDEMKPHEWLSYLESQKNTCVEILERLLCSLEVQFEYVSLSPRPDRKLI